MDIPKIACKWSIWDRISAIQWKAVKINSSVRMLFQILIIMLTSRINLSIEDIEKNFEFSLAPHRCSLSFRNSNFATICKNSISVLSEPKCSEKRILFDVSYVSINNSVLWTTGKIGHLLMLDDSCNFFQFSLLSVVFDFTVVTTRTIPNIIGIAQGSFKVERWLIF